MKSKMLKPEQKKYRENKLTCKRCGSNYILYIKMSNKQWCRKCGHTWENDDENLNKSK
jgi:rRNA maturation endonuclease Nob1